MHTIVSATADDAAAILSIQKRAFAEEARLCDDWLIPPLTEEVEDVVEHIQNQTVLTARRGSRIVGSVRGLVSGTVCTIRGLSIDLEHQGCGIGSALLCAIERAHTQVTSFELLTNSAMKGNVRFYERHGYHIKEVRQYSDRISLACMGKAAGAADTAGQALSK
jgi:ribosomal protein S18 acetylase RimI-like enzyme